MPAAIALDAITKRYGATVALADASLTVEAGETHALLGENGAGKSTLVKILSGLLRPDNGGIEIFGERVSLASRAESSRRGIEVAFQEIPLIPDLTVAENILLPDAPRRFGLWRDRRAARCRVEEILATYDLPEIDPEAEIRTLDLSLRQKIEILRAIARRPKILLLDEPSAALAAQDVAWLGERIAQLRGEGTTILLITHRIQEVRAYCDRLSILRNGRHVGTHRTEVIADREVFSLVMGRQVEAAFPPRRVPAPPAEPPLLAAARLTAGPRLRDVSFRLDAGEILGIAGLEGMGQLDLFNALFGVGHMSSGRVRVGGREMLLGSPRDAIRAGIGLVPEDRKIQGLALSMTGRENASLVALDGFTRFGLIDRSREAARVDAAFARLGVHPRAHHKRAGSFSGGNQQKIVLAKWLLTDCKILLAYDPTRGVDIGTKHEIYALLRDFADAGGAVLFYSTEVPELIGLADRVLVLYRGAIGAELGPAAMDEDAIGRAMLGAEVPAGVRHAEAVS
ncbi:sugar ABC transporter ATP-binding protein [Acidisoma sp. C75]